MQYKTTTLKVELSTHKVARVIMARPSVFNAFDAVMIAELDSVFKDLETNPDVRIIVLQGEGKHFSAGADLQWMQRASEASVEWNVQDSRQFAGMLATIAASSKPTIARIQGAALGGGVGLACACDLAVASSDASFSVSEAKFGILPSVIGPYLLSAVGKRQAKRLALTASWIGAQEAMSLGIVQQVVALDQLDASIEALTKDLLICGPNAQREIKTLYEKLPVGETGSEVVELTAQTIARVRGTAEAKEGFSAFLAKRPPNWM